jgi:hypothetical protein
VHCALHVLDSIGWRDNGFHVALIYQNQEFGMHVDLIKNEWTAILKDSFFMATYALLERACLECQRLGHTTLSCNNYSTFTVLQSQVGLMKGGMVNGRLRAEHHSQTFKQVDVDGLGGAFLKPKSAIGRTVQFDCSIRVGRKLRNQSRKPQDQVINAIFRAASPSYGGKAPAQDRSLLKDTVEVALKASQLIPVKTRGQIIQCQVKELIEADGQVSHSVSHWVHYFPYIFQFLFVDICWTLH